MNAETNNDRFDRILVVDDTTANLQFLMNLLTAQGYTVHPASEGELALEFAHSNLPDLILLDIRMPGMDGFEVCRRLKADERTCSIPIIFISALDSEQEKVKGFQAGAVDYITQPLQAEEVLARVRSHLHIRELTEHLKQEVARRTEELQVANAQLQRELAERKQAEAALRQSESLLNATQRLAGIGGWEWDVEQQTIVWTEEAYRIHGFDRQAFAPGTPRHVEQSLACYDAAHRPIIHAAFRRCLEQGDGYDLEYPFTSADGCRKWIRTTGTAVREGGRIVKVVGNIMDITERKRADKVVQARLRMLETAYAPEMTLDDTLRRMLDEIETQTESRIAFYHFMEEDQQTLSLQNWSTNTLTTMCTAEGKGHHYPVAGAGVWADCVRERRPVIHNDYASLPHHRGLPAGHAEVIREMVVPVFRGHRIVAIVGVGNKPVDYNETDLQIASLLGDISWEIVIRKQAEDAIRIFNEGLERRIKERTADLERMNRLFVGRELRMVEMKERIKELEKRIGGRAT